MSPQAETGFGFRSLPRGPPVPPPFSCFRITPYHRSFYMVTFILCSKKRQVLSRMLSRSQSTGSQFNPWPLLWNRYKNIQFALTTAAFLPNGHAGTSHNATTPTQRVSGCCFCFWLPRASADKGRRTRRRQQRQDPCCRGHAQSKASRHTADIGGPHAFLAALICWEGGATGLNKFTSRRCLMGLPHHMKRKRCQRKGTTASDLSPPEV